MSLTQGFCQQEETIQMKDCVGKVNRFWFTCHFLGCRVYGLACKMRILRWGILVDYWTITPTLYESRLQLGSATPRHWLFSKRILA